MGNEKLGSYAFLAGVILSILAGAFSVALASMEGLILLGLFVVGLLVGVLNISDKEVDKFLIAAIALGLISSSNLGVADQVFSGLGTTLNAIAQNLVRFVAPAALIVALKSIYGLAKEK